MAKDKKPENKIKTFSAIDGGKKKKITPKDSSKTRNARQQIYVNDARFKKAMDLIREDMNHALQLGNLANSQHYFLIKFLVQKGLIAEDEFARFVQQELASLEKEENKH